MSAFIFFLFLHATQHEIDSGRTPNVPAPKIAIDYWKLPQDATLRDVVLAGIFSFLSLLSSNIGLSLSLFLLATNLYAVRADEARHRDVNHRFADAILTNENPDIAHTIPINKQEMS
jgi:ubiquinol oxidase